MTSHTINLVTENGGIGEVVSECNSRTQAEETIQTMRRMNRDQQYTIVNADRADFSDF